MEGNKSEESFRETLLRKVENQEHQRFLKGIKERRRKEEEEYEAWKSIVEADITNVENYWKVKNPLYGKPLPPGEKTKPSYTFARTFFLCDDSGDDYLRPSRPRWWRRDQKPPCHVYRKIAYSHKLPNHQSYSSKFGAFVTVSNDWDGVNHKVIEDFVKKLDNDV
jgi:hypothetical protein